ncbi:MAG: stage 0 sporulation family protein [Deltaproteobacteria bacterium]|nr:stage 0 sporulation family protein [Candidatus Zymogenaceae bacterium]
MKRIVGVRFRERGKIYQFDALDFELDTSQKVVLETERGLSIGTVATLPRETEYGDSERPLKPVIRPASEQDLATESENSSREIEAREYCNECIDKHTLDMHLVDVEHLFDGSKIIFYFTADQRVDFRALVRDLASRFRTRIEMRQIGVRNKAKLVGGVGSCGRVLCCNTILNTFEPVSVKMAKDQNISLNPSKISGVCGRLMCCLKYEYETYLEMKREIPKLGKRIMTEHGKAKVIRQNVLERRVTVLLEDGTEMDLCGETLKKCDTEAKNRQIENDPEV